MFYHTGSSWHASAFLQLRGSCEVYWRFAYHLAYNPTPFTLHNSVLFGLNIQSIFWVKDATELRLKLSRYALFPVSSFLTLSRRVDSKNNSKHLWKNVWSLYTGDSSVEKRGIEITSKVGFRIRARYLAKFPRWRLEIQFFQQN